MQFTTTALILRKIPYGESDAILTFLTKEGGRLTGFAKGEAVSQKRFGGCLDLFNQVRLIGRKGREEMVFLSSAELVEVYPTLRSDLPKFAAACYFAEFVLFFLHEHETLISLYEVFSSFLYEFSQASSFKPHLIPLMEHQLLSLFGYKPELSFCIRCQMELHPDKEYFFHGAKGGVVCSGCAPTPTEYPLNYEILKKMTESFEMTPQNWGGLNWNPEEVRRARNAFEYFIQYTAGKPLKSLGFLSQILG